MQTGGSRPNSASWRERVTWCTALPTPLSVRDRFRDFEPPDRPIGRAFPPQVACAASRLTLFTIVASLARGKRAATISGRMLAEENCR